VKIIGLIALTVGLVFAWLGGKELVKTELRGIKGIPKRSITEGLYTRMDTRLTLASCPSSDGMLFSRVCTPSYLSYV